MIIGIIIVAPPEKVDDTLYVEPKILSEYRAT